MAIDDDLNEAEQVEQIRAWWHENWAWLLSGVALGIVLLVGWRYWTGRQTLNAEQAAAIYMDLIAASARNDFVQMESLHQQLGNDHDSTPYADQGSLLVARLYVETGEYDKAVTLLRDVMEGANDRELAAIGRVRLARVLIQQEQPDEALALLEPDTAGAFTATEHDVRGDALFAKGDMEGARVEYAAALAAQAGPSAGDRQLIELKLQDLPQPLPAAPAPTTEQATP